MIIYLIYFLNKALMQNSSLILNEVETLIYRNDLYIHIEKKYLVWRKLNIKLKNSQLLTLDNETIKIANLHIQ